MDIPQSRLLSTIRLVKIFANTVTMYRINIQLDLPQYEAI